MEAAVDRIEAGLSEMAGAELLRMVSAPASPASPKASGAIPEGGARKIYKHRRLAYHRITGKTEWQGTGYGRHGKRAKGRKTRKVHVHKSKARKSATPRPFQDHLGLTKLRMAVRLGVVPKARTAYALYLAERYQAQEGFPGGPYGP